MTTTVKVIASISALSALGGGGILASKLLNNVDKSDTINVRLTTEGFDINVGDNEWGEILTEHNKIKNVEGTFKNDANTDIDLNTLKSKCKSALDNKKNNDKDYKKARRWCVKAETIKAILVRGGYEILDSAEGSSTKDDEWKELAKELNKNKSAFPTIGNQMKNNLEEDFKALKKGCRELNVDSVKTITEGFDNKFDNLRDWCSLKKQVNKV